MVQTDTDFDSESLGKFFLSDNILNVIGHNLVSNQSLPRLSLESIFEVLIDLQLCFIFLFLYIFTRDGIGQAV